MEKEKSKRKDTKLESEGAEFLVLGHLLIMGVNSYKAYVNYPGYDLIATNPEKGKICKLQVKSRWATDYDKSFPIKSLESDFVVHVALNRGYSFSKKNKIDDDGVQSPKYYIIPTKTIAKYRRSGNWNKVKITDIPNYQKYDNNWNQILSFLKV